MKAELRSIGRVTLYGFSPQVFLPLVKAVVLGSIIAFLLLWSGCAVIASDGVYGGGEQQQASVSNQGEITDVSTVQTDGNGDDDSNVVMPKPEPKPVTVINNNYNKFIVNHPTAAVAHHYARHAAPRKSKPKGDGAAYVRTSTTTIIKIPNGSPVYLGGVTVNRPAPPAPIIHKEMKMSTEGLIAILTAFAAIVAAIAIIWAGNCKNIKAEKEPEIIEAKGNVEVAKIDAEAKREAAKNLGTAMSQFVNKFTPDQADEVDVNIGITPAGGNLNLSSKGGFGRQPNTTVTVQNP